MFTKLKLLIMVVTLFSIISFSTAANAEFTQKGQLGFTGLFGIGGVTNTWKDQEGAFALGIHLQAQYFVIDNLSVNFRFLWERYFCSINYVNYTTHHSDLNTTKYGYNVLPLVVGASYYFNIKDKLKAFVGGGMGMTISHIDYDDYDVDIYAENKYKTRTHFMLDLNTGIEYEIINNLTLVGMFDIMLPNLGNLRGHEETVGRFMFFCGATYHVNTFSNTFTKGDKVELIVEQPVVEQPVVEQPVVEQPVVK